MNAVSETDPKEKEPDEWVSATGAQASYLKTLSEECDEPDVALAKAEASKRIDALEAKRSPVRPR